MTIALGTRVTPQQRREGGRDAWIALKNPLPGKATRSLNASVTAVSQPGGPADGGNG